jgi:UPF0271 protein
MICDGFIPTTGGRKLSVNAGTLCVHGDTLGAVALTSALRTALVEHGVDIRAFAAQGSTRFPA